MSSDDYVAQARLLAEQRYLQECLDRFDNDNVTSAWRRYTHDKGYPSLCTFRKHVKHAGSVRKYMEWRFKNDIGHEWERWAVRDEEIDQLLLYAKQSRKPTMASRDLGHDVYGVLKDD